jgi:hypothetical protein
MKYLCRRYAAECGKVWKYFSIRAGGIQITLLHATAERPEQRFFHALFVAAGPPWSKVWKNLSIRAGGIQITLLHANAERPERLFHHLFVAAGPPWIKVGHSGLDPESTPCKAGKLSHDACQPCAEGVNNDRF